MTTNYESAGHLVAQHSRKIETPEHAMAVAQVEALRAVVDQLQLLTNEVARVAAGVEEVSGLLRQGQGVNAQ